MHPATPAAVAVGDPAVTGHAAPFRAVGLPDFSVLLPLVLQFLHNVWKQVPVSNPSLGETSEWLLKASELRQAT